MTRSKQPGARSKSSTLEGDAHLQLPLPLPAQENSQDKHTISLLLRFPWGKRVVEAPLSEQSFEPREAAYLRWVFERPTSSTKANHLLFLAQPLSYFPGKLIREGRSKRLRRGPWPTHGYT